MSANDLVKNFLGRPQNMDALKHWMGQEFSLFLKAAGIIKLAETAANTFRQHSGASHVGIH